MPPDLREELQVLSEESGAPVGELIRRAVREYVANEKVARFAARHPETQNRPAGRSRKEPTK